jgi:hypothetical protein
MQYFVYRQEGNLGPYSLDELRAQVAAGAVQPADLAWHEGLAQWEPVLNFLSAAPGVAVPPPAVVPNAAGAASAEATRLAYLSHEQNVRSIGTYFYFSGGMLLVLAAFLLLCGLIATLGGKGNSSVPLVIVTVECLVFVVMGGFLLWTAGKFKRLDPRGVIPGTILAVLGLLSIPIGTIINAFILYLIYSEKGRFVFSEPYRSVVDATPQIVCKMPLWVKIVIGLVILAFVSVVAISVLIALGHTVSGVSQAVH